MDPLLELLADARARHILFDWIVDGLQGSAEALRRLVERRLRHLQYRQRCREHLNDPLGRALAAPPSDPDA